MAEGLGRPRSRGRSIPWFNEVVRDIDDYVLLTADHVPFADLHEEGACIDAIVGACLFGVAQEGGINAGIAEAEGLAVDADGPTLSGTSRSVPCARRNRASP